MGRARITLKRIPKERTRKLTFKQRSKGLMKKIAEFSTMCGAEACFIVYDGNGNVEPMTWPEDSRVVHSIIEKYENQKNERPPKTFNIEDFFENRKNMVEAEISRVQKEISKIKYPTWDKSYSKLGEEQLKAFIAMLDAKIGACDHRINMFKNMHQSEANFNFIQNMVHEGATSSHASQLNFMQNVSQSQRIPIPLSQINDNNGMANFTNSTNQVDEAYFHRTNMLANLQQGDAYFNFMPNMAQVSGAPSHGSQLNFMQNISETQHNFESLRPQDDNNGMVNFTNPVDMPQDSTNQLGESNTNFANHLGEFERWVDEPTEIEEWINQLGGDLVDTVSQLDESVLQNTRVQSQNDRN
ncbi:agamous-like MADS-box protein AGL80 [Abrus precatorius]|uniref:Agamous-like MADS-box protein AGL80 n=1 Tax=Abrus precatorius TaxID=3816 RepID=A0A8B8K3T3_ABRPR|nr:agamous-like MADS-box protein AGL80 [Abrus precatorius]